MEFIRKNEVFSQIFVSIEPEITFHQYQQLWRIWHEVTLQAMRAIPGCWRAAVSVVLTAALEAAESGNNDVFLIEKNALLWRPGSTTQSVFPQTFCPPDM
jgi:hypothetical protein